MMEKIKILMALRENGQNGGPYVSHKRIMESRLKEKYNFIVLNVPRARQLLNPLEMIKFIKTIKREKPGLVHIAGLQLEGFLPMVACNIAGIKTVLAVHGSIAEAENLSSTRKFIANLYEIYTLKHADMVYAVSKYVAKWKLCRYAKNFYGVIYNFCGIEGVSKESSIRQELGISVNDIVVVSTGRIIKEKGYDILWETIQKLGHSERVKYIIVGNGNYLNTLKKEIKEKQYDKEVFCLGYRSDIDNLLSGSDVFIMCSKHETLCISLLEAARHSLPLVGTNVGGIPEIIENNKNGFLVNNLDIDGFAQALSRLIKNSDLRVRMGKKSQDISIKRFSNCNIEKKIDDMYSRILKE